MYYHPSRRHESSSTEQRSMGKSSDKRERERKRKREREWKRKRDPHTAIELVVTNQTKRLNKCSRTRRKTIFSNIALTFSNDYQRTKNSELSTQEQKRASNIQYEKKTGLAGLGSVLFTAHLNNGVAYTHYTIDIT